MKITRVSTLREFDVPEKSTPDCPIQLFDSYGYDPAKGLTRFARYLDTLDRQWDQTFVVKDKATVIGSGEDPRPFFWRGSICVSAQSYTPDHQYVNKVYILNEDRWLTVIPPKTVKPGKNWAPFVFNDELHFVHEFSPFRVFKARFVSENDGFMLLDVVAEHPIRVPKSLDKYSRLRGGSCGVQVGDMVIGAGHTNDAVQNQKNHLEHRPFFFVYVPGKRVTYYTFDFDFTNDYCIVDPTSMYLKDRKLFLVTSETEITWNWPQTGRTCLYEIDFEGEIREESFDTGCRRIHRWAHDEAPERRGLLGRWRRS